MYLKIVEMMVPYLKSTLQSAETPDQNISQGHACLYTCKAIQNLTNILFVPILVFHKSLIMVNILFLHLQKYNDKHINKTINAISLPLPSSIIRFYIVP
jgi:hypothetical protein